MQVIYRNFKLDAHKEKSLAGYLLLYFAIYDKEGYEYGIPLINKVLLGWLPRRVFHGKMI